MQAHAYRSAKQLPSAASSAINTGRRTSGSTSSVNKHYLKITGNIPAVAKPWSVMYGRWVTMLSTTNRSILPQRFISRSYTMGASATRLRICQFKENVRSYSSSSKHKYCLKRLVRREKTSRAKVGLNSIKDIVSGANETIQQSASVLRDRALQAVFAMNGQVMPTSATAHQRFIIQNSVASCSDVNKTSQRLIEKELSTSSTDKTSETYIAADLPVTSNQDSFLPLSRVSSEAVADMKTKHRQRIAGAISRIPSPSWERVRLNVMPLVSRISGRRSEPSEEVVAADTCDLTHTVGETKVEFVTVEGVATRDERVQHKDNEHTVHGTVAGGFDCDEVSKANIVPTSNNTTGSTIHATNINDITITAAEPKGPKTNHRDSNMYSRISTNLRGKLPPLNIPTIAMSDRLSSLSDTTSKVRQKVGAVNLTKWKSASSADEKSPDFDLDSPHLFSSTQQHSKKEEVHGDASQVADQLLSSANDSVKDRSKVASKSQETAADKAKKTTKKIVKPVVSKASIDSRTKTLAMGIKMSQSHSSCLIKLERLNNHLVQYPESVEIATLEKLIPCLLKLRHKTTRDNDLLAQIHKTLALLGHADPVKGRGIRVLALDGGGCRGIIAIESLREIERRTNQDIRDMFDYVVGVSSGAVLAYLLSFMNASLDQCEELFRELGREVFERNRVLGTSKLLFNHAYYDTDRWISILKQHAAGNVKLCDTAMDPNAPKVAAITNKINGFSIKNFVFRNYHLPTGSHSQYQGSVKYQCWEALRASSAAPGYFEEFKLDDNVFQDGGVLTNNPSAVGLHECRLLWPNTPIQCVVSLGTGNHSPCDQEYGTEYSSLKKKLVTIMQSATETESVHTILQDLLPSGTYFRFNPLISEDFSLDESRQDKLTHMQGEAQEYLCNNRTKLDEAAKQLSLQKTPIQKGQDWLKLQQTLHT